MKTIEESHMKCRKYFKMMLIVNIKSSVSDPYSFFTDPDPDPVDPDGGQYGSGSNPDPGL